MTWSAEPSAALIEDARRVAREWTLPLFERPRKRGLVRHLGVVASVFLVRSGRGWHLIDGEGELGVSPGIAMLRLKRLATGSQMPDLLVRLAALAPGEIVIDATLGLGADARVMASTVGPMGKVIGLEASKPLAVLMAEGLKLEPRWPDSALIDVHHSTAHAFLKSQPSKSADVVVFDPMFERTKASSPAFAELRRFADMTPLDQLTVDEAKRVARRLVLMKSSVPEVFPSLGLEPLSPTRNAIVFWGRALVER